MREHAKKFVEMHADAIRRRAPSLKEDADLTGLIADVMQWLVHDEQAEEYEREHMRTSVQLRTGEKSEALANKYVEQDAARKLAFEDPDADKCRDGHEHAERGDLERADAKECGIHARRGKRREVSSSWSG